MAVKRPAEAVGGRKKPRVAKFPGRGERIDDFGPSGGGLGLGKKDVPDRAGFAAFSGSAARLPVDVPTARPRPSQAVAAAAADRMQDILERKRGGGGGDFARQVAEEARRRRGGAPGDVVPLGKRKRPEPNEPRSILRKRGGPPTQRQRTGTVSSTPQLFNIGV